MKWTSVLLANALASLAIAFASPCWANVCETEANATEQALHLPQELLLAIGRVESGRPGEGGRVAPWPWSVNAAGEGHFLASKAEAIELVQTLQAQGIRSIDVGCFQVNLLHHPDSFQTLSDAFDPAQNARAAGLFLTSLYASYSNWDQAIAAYHSANPSIGMPYLDLIRAAWHSSATGVTVRVSFVAAVQVFVPGQGRGEARPSSFLLHPAARSLGSHLPQVIVPAMSPL